MKRQEARDAKNLEDLSKELDRDVSEVVVERAAARAQVQAAVAAIEVLRILGPGFLEAVHLTWRPGA